MKRKTTTQHTRSTKSSPQVARNESRQTTNKPAKKPTLSQRRRAFLARRPHRSFRVTRRRDYQRSLQLPGYWALTVQVVKLLWRHKWTFICLALIYAVLMVVVSGLISPDVYQQLRDQITQHQGDVPNAAVATIATFIGVVIGQLTGSATDNLNQQAVGGLIGLFVWLSTIWLVRVILGGKTPRMRDGVYNSGGPVLALAVLVVVLILQLLPAAIAIILYDAASSSGVLTHTAVLMLAGGATALVGVLSLYWATSTVFAMIIVTLPGTYPLEALRLAGDLVIGRRMRILLRFTWLAFVILLMWVVILVPVIIIDDVVKKAIPIVSQLQLVPITALLLAAASVVVGAAYTMLFYRKVVDDDAAPA